MTKAEHLSLIKEANKAYYELDSPIMSDLEYDNLYYDYIDSYGEKDLDFVAGKRVETLTPYTHTANMNSLDKIKHSEESKLKKALEKLYPVAIENKIDGLTIVAYPVDGHSSFVTRGNGTVGEILPRFPKKYTDKNTSQYPIRGEAFLLKSSLKQINEERKFQGLDLFANERNAASGIMRRLEDNPYIEHIKFIAYDVIGLDLSEEKKLQYIREHTCFDTIEYVIKESEAESFIPKYYKQNVDLDMPIDGVVIKSNTDGSLKKFGSTKHHPLNAFAWKAENEQHVSTLRQVNWQVGREVISPVAKFDGVIIDGTLVQEASLSNWGLIKDLDLKINDTIMVEKRNQIIPHIASVIKHNEDSKEIVHPTICPCCSEKLKKRKLKNTKAKTDSEHMFELYCDNPICSGKLESNIDFVFSKKCLNAKGLSRKTIQKLVYAKKVQSITDMFNVTKEDLQELEGFSDKKTELIFEAIQNARKDVPLNIFIPSCGVLNIGFDLGNILAKEFVTYEALLNNLESRNIDLFTSLKGVGTVYAKKLVSDEFISAYKNLRRFIAPIEVSCPKVTKSVCNSFVITGELSQPRGYFKKLIEDNGDKVASAVSKSTYALVTDNPDSNSSKAKKAREFNIIIMTEKDLINYLNK